SLTVDSSDGLACATSARFWECLLEKHRLPYLLLRVADMLMSLGSKVTGIILYGEVSSLRRTMDDRFMLKIYSCKDYWEIHSSLFRIMMHHLVISASQRWRSAAGTDTCPYCRLQRAQIASIRDDWQKMDPPMDIKANFFNLHCLETNVIEGTVQFDESVCLSSVQLLRLKVVYHISFFDIEDPINGAVRDRDDAISILQDTHNVLNEIFYILQSGPINLTVESICRLHTQLMKTSRVICAESNRGHRLSYFNVGVTRQTSRANVTATLRNQNTILPFG
ncbi:hypothetical protein CPB84DRAFT_1915496, partial [Gymnopilus junonius]